MNKDEFYIGYQKKLPPGILKKIKRSILFLLVLFCGSGIGIAMHHRYISSSSFELGNFSKLEGFYFNEPVPLIKVVEGKDIHGNLVFKSIPLVNYAKFGADELVKAYEEKNQISLHGRRVTLLGTLLYDDGKALLELSKREASILEASEVIDADLRKQIAPDMERLGRQSIKGEIIDSKCYFGAMRPGFGKPHRACAVRCISGGIPPVLAATNYEGAINYFLIRGSNKEAINKEVIPYVSEPVILTGDLVRFDDWMVLYIDPEKGIARE